MTRRDLFRGWGQKERRVDLPVCQEKKAGQEAYPTSPPPMPSLVEAMLSEAEVDQLFAELSTHAKVLSALGKSAAHDHANTGLVLAEAKRQLFSGTVRAVQIRYVYEGSEWTDTLFRQPTGVRMVRCKHE
jgi:hypothetical protein